VKVFARTPLDWQEIVPPLGKIYLIPERCKGCKLCVEFCPQQVLAISDQMNAKGYRLPEIAAGKETACVHCDFCTVICPEFAIFSMELET
jgi:2-oxoglutarate ferredoxin oxidoreductase subunit delta